MNAEFKTDAEASLQFFGKMTASISHEIKNVLAIINENAGLLDDLALIAERGGAIEPQRLKNMSQAVMKQVRRADAIIANMNRLAHSADESNRTVDLNDLLQLLVALSKRFASMRGIAVQVKPSQGLLKLRTSPFFLMNLLWLCLDFAMDEAGEDKKVELIPHKTEDGIEVYFKGLDHLAGAPVKPFPAESEKRLCELLRAEVEIRSRSKAMVVRFPQNINP